MRTNNGRRKILYVCTENLFETGILQSMVLRPSQEISKKYDVDVGFTSMSKSSDGHNFFQLREQTISEFYVMEGKRSVSAMSISNVFLHLFFAIKLVKKSSKYDVLHCRSYIATFFGCIVKMFCDVLVVFDVRGYLIDEAIEVGKLKQGSFKEKILRWIERLIFRRSDKIISVSEKMRVDIKRRFGRESILIPNPTFFPDTGPTHLMRKEIVYIGSLNEWHLPVLFFECMSEVLSKRPEYKLKILTPQVDQAKTFAEKFMINRYQFTALNVASDQVLSHALGASLGWCVIKPSFSKSVCAPVKFNEYIAAGVPTIVNGGIGDLSELVQRYKLGIVASNINTPTSIAQQIIDYLDDKVATPLEIDCNFRTEIDYNHNIEKLWKLYELCPKASDGLK